MTTVTCEIPAIGRIGMFGYGAREGEVALESPACAGNDKAGIRLLCDKAMRRGEELAERMPG